MKKFFYNLILFVKKIFFGTRELPEINTVKDAEFLYDLGNAIKEFRLSNYVLPLAYNKTIEIYAQENANFNYLYNSLNDKQSDSLLKLQLKTHKLEITCSNLLCIKTEGTYKDCFREITANSKYRNAILDGFHTLYAIGKCGPYISIILAH